MNEDQMKGVGEKVKGKINEGAVRWRTIPHRKRGAALSRSRAKCARTSTAPVLTDGTDTAKP